MSSDAVTNLEIPFTKVFRKNRKSKLKQPGPHNLYISQPLTEEERLRAIRRIHKAKEDLSQSSLFKSISVAFEKGLKILNRNTVQEIICLGLGKVGESLTPKYQLAVLLCLTDIHKIEIKVCDPVFTDDDLFILNKFNVEVLSENVEGKYLASPKATLFFLPHCPKQLTNNILWKNWGLNLCNCILLCNSFNKIIDQNTSSDLSKAANFIVEIASYAEEILIENTFKFDDIFNDTSLHVFPLAKLKDLPDTFWELISEPEYNAEDTEFIKREY